MPELLNLVAEPRRQRILQLVWERELPAGEIAASFDTTFGAVSQHLRVLRDAGLVVQRKDGRRRLYRASREALGPIAAVLETFWADALSRLRVLAEAEERRTRRSRSHTRPTITRRNRR